jgi:hypothetical protein
MRQLSQVRHQALSQTLVEAARETVLDRPLPDRVMLVKGDGALVLVDRRSHQQIPGTKPTTTAQYYRH